MKNENGKPKLTRYLVVEANSGQELVDKVAEFTEKGYVPAGGVCVLFAGFESEDAEHFAQAMFLPKRRTPALERFLRGIIKMFREMSVPDDTMPTP